MTVTSLTGGQRQHTLLAQEILRGCEIFLFDAPATGLDRPHPATRLAGVNERRWWWALVAVTLGHLLALYLPGSPDPGPDLIPHLDKVVHVALFAAPTFLVRRLTTAWSPVVLIALHAPVSELVQYHFIPRRSGDPMDLVADGVGVALGLLLAAYLPRRGVSEGSPSTTPH